jgi:hypothetical protein
MRKDSFFVRDPAVEFKLTTKDAKSTKEKEFNHKEPSAAEPQPKQYFTTE